MDSNTYGIYGYKCNRDKMSHANNQEVMMDILQRDIIPSIRGTRSGKRKTKKLSSYNYGKL